MTVRPSEQAPASAVARIDATDRTSAQVWRAIATSRGFQDALVDGVRDLLAGVAHHDRRRELEDAGVTAAEGGYATVLRALDRPSENDRHQEALETTARFGAAEASILGHLPLNDVSHGPLVALSAAGVEPTVTVRLDYEFRERPHAEREAVLSLLARVGQACDVRVVTTGLTARLLVREHRDVLPAEFSDAVDAHRPEAPAVDDAVEAARDALAPDGREESILRRLADEPGETLPYSELVATSTVSKGRVSQLLGTLEDLDLAERYGPRDDKHVELRPAGSALLDALDAERGRQAELDAAFSDPSQFSQQCRVTPRAHEPPLPTEADATAAGGDPYRTRYLNRPAHHAAAAAVEDGSITAVEAGFDEEETRTRWVSYNDRRDEVVVAVRASTALQYVTSTALAFSSPRLFDRVLTPDRLEAIDVPDEVLRDGRCIGGLSAEAAEDGQVLRDTLVEWGETLAELTTKLRHGDHEQDRDTLRGEIMRSAHGLAGTIVHLLDVAGVDVVRELRVPRWLPHDRLAGIAKAVSVATAIQSEYSDRTLYRQVFEEREEKRASAFGVDVDAADPFGRYIGGLVLRGPDAHRLANHVEGQLASPAPIHEDAPEIAVKISVRTPNRSTYAEAVARMGSEKRLDPTRDAVTVCRALTGSPYAVADALHALGSEPMARDIEPDEVRAALGHLGTDRLLPEAPPTVGKMVQALLRSTTALSPGALAEAADVSTASAHRYMDVLEALSLVERTDDGVRFALPTREERGEPIRPAVLEDTAAARQDLLFDVAMVLAEGGPPTDLLTAVFTDGYDESLLRRRIPDADPWIRVAKVLCSDPEYPDSAVTVGNPTAQVAL